MHVWGSTKHAGAHGALPVIMSIIGPRETHAYRARPNQTSLGSYSSGPGSMVAVWL